MAKCLLVLSILAWNFFTSPEVPKKEIWKNQLILDFGKRVESRGLRLAGIGGGIDHDTGKLKYFIVEFGTDRLADVSAARIAFVTLMIDFLDIVNSQKGTQEHLSNYPATLNNIKLAILCMKSKPGEIAHVFNLGNEISYYKNVDEPCHAREALEETYEEAKAIVEAERDGDKQLEGR